jgi:nitronate monooxygenase
MELKPLEIGNLLAKFPIIQGGMGVGVSLSGLAGAVALHGGIGIISTAQIGYREPDFDKHPLEANLREIKNQIEKAKKIAKDGIIGVNIMVATKKYEQYVKTAAAAGADLIISGAGLPTMLPKFVEGFQTKIAPIVSSIKSASVICKLWDRKYQRIPDLVVIEGPRAGGHLGFTVDQIENSTRESFDEEIKGIISIVKEYALKYKKKIPVITAGGIYTREDIEHSLSIGADGVQMGTRFVTTYECDADEKYKMTYINAQKEDIKIVKSPVGMPGRAIENEFMIKTKTEKPSIPICHQCLEKCNRAEIPYCITDALINAAKGNVDKALLFCGDNAYRATKLESVEEIMKELTTDN